MADDAGTADGDGGSGASYALTVNLVGAGRGESVVSSDGAFSCGPGPVIPPCTASFAGGTVVTLAAQVGDSGFSFGGWSGGGCSGTGDCVTTLDSAQAVTATFHAKLTYLDSDDLVVPTGISSIGVELWGGGGQGAFVGSYNSTLACYTGTGAGGGGAYNAAMLAVTAGNSYHITVGCGACKTSSDLKQYNLGGDTSFGTLLSAGGGQGGYDSPPNGGPGGTCSGAGCVPGSMGSAGSTSSCMGGDGGAAGGPAGGAGGVYGATSGNGQVPGGGGAGSEGIAGGLGASGQVIVSW